MGTTQGLMTNYLVWKIDHDTGQLVDPGPVFVLNYRRDRYARAALRAYAVACAGEHPELANDLLRELGSSFEIRDGKMVLRDPEGQEGT